MAPHHRKSWKTTPMSAHSLPKSALRLYVLLHLGKKQLGGELRLNLAEIGERIHRSRRTVNEALAILVVAGYLKRLRRGTYTLSEPT